MNDDPLSPRDSFPHASAPRDERPEMEAPFVQPVGIFQEFLADCWCEVLRLRAVGVRDNFFLLGGDSIHMWQIVARVQEKWNVELSAEYFFHYPTIAEHAKFIENQLKR